MAQKPDRSDAAKKAAETRRQRKLEAEYAAHNIRRPDPDTGEIEIVSTPGHPEVERHPADPLPEGVTFTVQREGSTAFVDGRGQLVLRWSGPGNVTHAQLTLTVTDRDTYERLTSGTAAWWDVLLSARHSRP